MKKLITILLLCLSLTLGAFCFVGCGEKKQNNTNNNQNTTQTPNDNQTPGNNDNASNEDGDKEEPKELAYKRVNASGEADDDGDYVLFGSYPQTEVKDATLKTALDAYKGTLPTEDNNGDWTDYGYFVLNSKTSYTWFKDVTHTDGEKYRAVYFTQYRPKTVDGASGDWASFQDDNGYLINNVYWFKFEPIKWRIMTEQGGNALLLSELILDSQNLNATASNNYAESSIRTFLTQTFYKTAFVEGEQGIINTIEVNNGSSSTLDEIYNQYLCANTFDKIFLPSTKEISTASYGFTNDASRQKYATDYAKSQGMEVDTIYANYSKYWSRSPHLLYVSDVIPVSADGTLNSYAYVVNTCYGVVPALEIKL